MALKSAALTTTFTPAPSCTNDFYTAPTYYSIGGPSASNCFPSSWDSTSQYFSPGICPVGYTKACSGLSISGSVTETQATCCPTGYVCYTPTIFNYVGQACASIFTDVITTTVTDGTALTTLVATLHQSTEAVNGYGVSIRYKAGDFASVTSSSTGSGTSATTAPSANTQSSSTASGTSSSTSSTTTPTSQPSSGLSTGAKAGIGAGVGVVALIALIGLALLFIRRRKANAQGRNPPEYKPVEMPGAADSSQESWGGRPKKTVHEFYTPPAELG